MTISFLNTRLARKTRQHVVYLSYMRLVCAGPRLGPRARPPQALPVTTGHVANAWRAVCTPTGRRKAVAPPCASGSSYSPVLAVPEEPSLTGPAIANSIVAFQTLRRSDEVREAQGISAAGGAMSSPATNSRPGARPQVEARPAVPLMVVLCDELVAGCGLQPEVRRRSMRP